MADRGMVQLLLTFWCESWHTIPLLYSNLNEFKYVSYIKLWTGMNYLTSGCKWYSTMLTTGPPRRDIKWKHSLEIKSMILLWFCFLGLNKRFILQELNPTILIVYSFQGQTLIVLKFDINYNGYTAVYNSYNLLVYIL